MRIKLLQATAVLAFAVILFPSCKKCQDCDCGTTVEEVCEDDFNSKEEYDLAIDFLEAFGCTCS